MIKVNYFFSMFLFFEETLKEVYYYTNFGYHKDKYLLQVYQSTYLLSFTEENLISLRSFTIYLISSIKFFICFKPNFVQNRIPCHLWIAFHNNLGHSQGITIIVLDCKHFNQKHRIIFNCTDKLLKFSMYSSCKRNLLY